MFSQEQQVEFYSSLDYIWDSLWCTTYELFLYNSFVRTKPGGQTQVLFASPYTDCKVEGRYFLVKNHLRKIICRIFLVHVVCHFLSTCPSDFFEAVGDRRAHENPALLSLSIMFMRYHNVMAREIAAQPLEEGRQAPTDRELFFKARSRTTAVLQVS